jgi:hypothetical protein
MSSDRDNPPDYQVYDRKQKRAEQGRALIEAGAPAPGSQQDPAFGPPGEFQPPRAQFSPEAMAGPGTGPDAREKWYKLVTEELKEYWAGYDAAYLQHMALNGRMREYLLQQQNQAGGAVLKENLRALQDAIPHTDFRDPEKVTAWTREVEAIGRVPEFADEAVQTIGERQQYEGLIRNVLARRQQIAEETAGRVAEESQRSPTLDVAVPAFVKGLNPADFRSMGDPKARVMAALSDSVDEATKDYVKSYYASPNPSRHAPRPEDVRDIYTNAGLAALAKAAQGANLSESGAESFARHSAEILGMLAGSAGLKAAVKGVGVLAKGAATAAAAGEAASGLAKAADLATRAGTWIFRSPRLLEAGAFVGLGAAHGLSNEQKAALLIGPDGKPRHMTEEQRAEAERNGSMANGVLGYLMLPALHYSGAVGRVLTLGTLKRKGTRFLETAVGMPVLAEASEAAFHGMRNWMVEKSKSEEVKRQSDLLLITHPEVRGPLWRMVTAESADELVEAAKDYGKAMLPNAAALGAWAGVAALVPHAVNRHMASLTEKDVDSFMKGEIAGEVIKTAVKGSEVAATDPSAMAELKRQHGDAGEAAVKTRVRRKREAAAAKEPEAAAAERDANAYEAAAERSANEAEAAKMRSAARQMREAADDVLAGREVKALDAGEETTQRAATRGMIEEPPAREEAAAELLRGEMERQQVSERTRALNEAIARNVGRRAFEMETIPFEKGDRFRFLEPERPGIKPEDLEASVVEPPDARGRILIRDAQGREMRIDPRRYQLEAIDAGPPPERKPDVPYEATMKRLQAEEDVRAAKEPDLAEAERRAEESAAEEAQAYADERARIARADAEKRTRATAEAPDFEAPPPGESQTPPRVRTSIEHVDDLRKEGLLQAMTEGREVSPKSEVGKEFAEFAKDREGTTQDKLAAFLRQKADEPQRGETFSASLKRLNADIDQIASMPPGQRPEAVRALLDRHLDVLTGPELTVMRTLPEGVRALNRIEALIALAESEIGAIGIGPLSLNRVKDAWNVVRSVWPWATPEGLNIFGMNPRYQTELARRFTQLMMKDPDISVDAINAGLLGKAFGRLKRALGAEHPETWGGLPVHEAVLASQEFIARARDLLRSFIGKDVGMLRPIMGKGHAVERQALFDALNKGPGSAEWKALTPQQETWANHIRDVLREIWVKLDSVSPRRVHLRRETEVVRTQLERAKKLQDAGAEAKFTKRLAALEKALAEPAELRGIAEFVHHVRVNQDVTMESYARKSPTQPFATATTASAGTMKRRTGALEESGELSRDIVDSLVAYIPQAVSYFYRNRWYAKWHETLHGRESVATFPDLVRPDPQAVYHYRGRDYAVFGEVLVDKKTGALRPGRAEGADGKQEKVPAIEGEVRRTLLMDWRDRTEVFMQAPPRPSLETIRKSILADYEALRSRSPTLHRTPGASAAYRLLDSHESMEVTVRRGGWFKRASPQRARDMTEVLDAFAGGMRDLQLKPLPLGNLFAKGARISSWSKLALSPFTAANILFGAMFQNSQTQHPKQLSESTLRAVEFYARYRTARNAPLLPAELAKSTGFKFGGALMRSTAAQLAKTPAKNLAERQMWDDAYEELAKHPLFEAKFSDLARRLFDDKPGAGGAAAKILAALGRKQKSEGEQFWKAQTKFTGMEMVGWADHMGRTVNFLGVYMGARRAGESHAEAARLATADVVRNHGVFTAVTRAPIMRTNAGQFLFGLQTYIMRQFDIWTKMPWEYKVRYASLALGTNYFWRTMGWGDLTNTIGFSAWDSPLVGDAGMTLALGDDDKRKPGFLRESLRSGMIPVPFNVPGGPGMQALRGVGRAIGDIIQGKSPKGDLIGAARSVFEPSILTSIHKAYGTTPSPGGYEYVPYFRQQIEGDTRPSYTLQQQGVAQFLSDLIPGQQIEIAKAEDRANVARAVGARIQVERGNLRGEAKDLLRQYDQAKKAGMMTDTLRKQTREQWETMSKRGRELGYDVPGSVNELRKANRIDALPRDLRAVVQAGSKEAQVRLLTEVIDSGVSRDRLKQLSDVMAGQKSLSGWAMDPDAVSPETRKAYRAAVTRWRERESTSQPPQSRR